MHCSYKYQPINAIHRNNHCLFNDHKHTQTEGVRQTQVLQMLQWYIDRLLCFAGSNGHL